mmetsp:Transcript_7121/g.22846  ORF Transcript_7121/g.22846 Transcript_7121/m.22846 type:complete len:254 (+) Transcript_7121:272-1033(+)
MLPLKQLSKKNSPKVLLSQLLMMICRAWLATGSRVNWANTTGSHSVAPSAAPKSLRRTAPHDLWRGEVYCSTSWMTGLACASPQARLTSLASHLVMSTRNEWSEAVSSESPLVDVRPREAPKSPSCVARFFLPFSGLGSLPASSEMSERKTCVAHGSKSMSHQRPLLTMRRHRSATSSRNVAFAAFSAAASSLSSSSLSSSSSSSFSLSSLPALASLFALVSAPAAPKRSAKARVRTDCTTCEPWRLEHRKPK